MAQFFNRRIYESDAGKKYNIRIGNPANTIAANASSTGTPDDGNVDVSVSHHGQKKRVGINSRGVRLGLPATAPATGYTKQTFCPILTRAYYDTLTKGDILAFNGGNWTILDKIAEV